MFAQLYNNRGNVLSDKGDRPRAIQDFSEAIRRAPGEIDGYINRGNEYVLLKQFDYGIADLNQAIRINPKDSDAYFDRGIAYAWKKDSRAAIADYTRANELSPHDPVILNSIGWLKATCPLDPIRNGKEAVEMSLEACRLTDFKNADYLETLAAASAEAGDFDRAIQFTTRSLKLNIASADRKEFEKRLALYRERKPCRELTSANW